MGIGDMMGKLGDMNKLRGSRRWLWQKFGWANDYRRRENGVRVVITGDQKIIEISVQGIGNPVLNEVLKQKLSAKVRSWQRRN